MVIAPMKRPDLFRGIRAPRGGLLLYGPPGTGKTMIGKVIASRTGSTFFSISASSLTSKWIGDGEKLVRALFAVARLLQPAVIFVDEIDSLLSQRKDDGAEHESSRRLKTQFLVEMDGCKDGRDDRVLVVGATNRPHDLDPAVRRRMISVYMPLPEAAARKDMVKKKLADDNLLTLSEEEIEVILAKTEGYSGSDLGHLVREAAMEPLRAAMAEHGIDNVRADDIRPVALQDFEKALSIVRPTVAPSELLALEEWGRQFGDGMSR
eukprot:TRINITY_DN8370_c0_g1_i2.p1 TRINITY_DN8370_c0_g1~~TRINITY_DN8370_c0_g1_i2.p1  ORF type:complete len:265 (+),score=55.92 TRINITY_DN8370_c0_g1_i2:232-1026(+)